VCDRGFTEPPDIEAILSMPMIKLVSPAVFGLRAEIRRNYVGSKTLPTSIPYIKGQTCATQNVFLHSSAGVKF